MFCGVSNVLAVFRMFWCFVVFRMFLGVLDKLLHFNLNIRVCCEQLGLHLFLGVFCTYGPPYMIKGKWPLKYL